MIPKKYHILIDCEFIPKAGLCYNIGGLIIDNKGNVVKEFDFLIKEVIDEIILNTHVLSTDKKVKYFNLLAKEKIQIKPIYNIIEYIENLYNEYNIDLFMSYNLNNDLRVLNNTSRYFIKRKFLIKGKNYKCLQKASKQIFYNRPTYKHYCKQNNLITNNNTLRYRAKDFYGYITGNVDFNQEHTALADCYMELTIYKKIKSQHKKF